MLAAGGSKGEVAVWDTEENETIATHFASAIDKSRIVEQEESEEEEEEESDDGEERKKSSKKQEKRQEKKQQMKQLNKISEGIQRIRDMKKKK